MDVHMYDMCIHYFYGSPDYKNRETRKMFYTKQIILSMLNIFYILSEKKFRGRGVDPHPSDGGHVP